MKTKRWICSTLGLLALAAAAGLCQAQSAINISFDSSTPTQFYDASPANTGGSLTYAWQSTGGPDGSGCEVYNIDGVIDQEIDPAFNVSFTSGQYYQVTFQMKVDASSGTVGYLGSGGYGHFQMALRDASYSWVSVGYQTLYSPGANGWVTYTFAIPSPSISVAHLQFQLQGGGAYSGPVTVYVGNLSVQPIPNPNILSAFTNDFGTAWNNYGMAASWDSAQDAPYYNPVTGAGPTSITPAGSIEFQPTVPNSYQGGQLNLGFNPSQFQWVGLDVYYDGPTPGSSTDFGGMQMFIANGSAPYNWVRIGGINFNAGMVGKWTHYNWPCAASGVLNAAGFAFQATPGSTAGATPITFHVDNIQTWNPVTKPILGQFTPGTPGGVRISVDNDGTSNPNDQEGITAPATNCTGINFFWVGQTPATYSFSLTNFPSPASAPGFDAHVYIVNGSTIESGPNDWGYNQTYSYNAYNALDCADFHIQNSASNNGVVAVFEWKTNSINANPTNITKLYFPQYASANGTWTLTFNTDTSATTYGPDGASAGSLTLPDFASDPNYDDNFSPSDSLVTFGVAKNGAVNNGMSATFTQVVVTNASQGVLYDESFSGPGLTANLDWQVAEYYMDSANRATWLPPGTAWWIQWNTTQSGWSVQASSNLLNWVSAGVTYSYVDTTGTNTLGAIPYASLPAGKNAFFRLTQ